MIRNIIKIVITKTARRTALGCLLLFFVAGNVWAQHSNDPRYVIKCTVGETPHYLAHVEIEVHDGDSTYWYWVLRDVTVFHPDSCLWQSGPNIGYNYYFKDNRYSKYHYLNAVLETNAPLSLSAAHPGTQLLNTPSSDYYFYDWDHGVARGVDHAMSDCIEDYHMPSYITNQCWEVVWVTYNGGWKMSSNYCYNPDPHYITNAAPYRNVTVTSHGEERTDVSGGINCSSIGDITMSTVGQSVSPDGTASAYTYTLTPAYTLYDIEAVHSQDNHTNPPTVFFDVPQELHYFYEGSDHNAAPGSTTYTNVAPTGYAWSLTGDAGGYLSLTNANTATPTLTYVNQNISNSHEFATLTLTVTYGTGTSQTTQTCSATVTVITQCQNPEQASAPVVTYEDVTVSWYATAPKYKVYWKKHSDEWSETNSHVVENATSYRITTGLEYGTNGTDYDYKVSAYCGGSYQDVPHELIYTFKTKPQPQGLVYGAVFGGGRMADVGGKTEVVIINCDSISAVFGGNDIAGSVQGSDGSKITLGVNDGGEYASFYGTTNASVGVKVSSVYGGGNGYYAYNGTSFEAASYDTEYNIEDGASINAMTPMHTVGGPVWINNTGETVHLLNPRIQKTNITVNHNSVVIDSLFGGAKNAILQNTENDVNITINGGTIFAVFGGNNFGGSLGYMSNENITVNNTKTVASYGSLESGRDFGIRYLFGGGNKIMGQHVNINITGGQCDTVFGGGNAADVRSTAVLVNCELGTAANGAYGKVFSNAINGYSAGDGISIDDDYTWDGTGIYNIRTLFGGNNKANMEGLPTLTLTSGGIGTVYGGGNAGDMLAEVAATLTIPTSFGHDDETLNIKYGTHVVVADDDSNQTEILIDNLYGGCQMSNVYYSALTEVQGGHVGTVFGGCNISGDVGSTRVHLDATPFINEDEPNPLYQQVYGATFVVASGGTIYKDLFAGSNGMYHCNDGIRYVSGLNYADPEGRYLDMLIPTHNETYAIVKDDVHIKGNVYAGANMAPVGFTISYVSQYQSFPSLVGLAAVRMSGGTVDGNVFGGGNMASINGSNEVQISGGSIGMANDGALYGGNDRTGKAGQISNRLLPESYNVASDGETSLKTPRAKTYIGVTGRPIINTVYGGGNGLYAYFSTFEEASAYSGPLEPVVSCNLNDKPIQSNIFVDIAIEGGANGATPGHIDYVYGGGNGVTADGFVKVFINVLNMSTDADGVITDGIHIGTVFGGNNIGELDVPADIILFHGHVGDVYGGCNAGGMSAYGLRTRSFTVNIDGTDHTYSDIGSYVCLFEEYDGNGDGEAIPTNVMISGNVYGGCRMNDVRGIDRTNPNPALWEYHNTNTLVLVKAHVHSATLFGGCDIKGKVWGTSQVVTTGGHVNRIFGSGNGNYDYVSDGNVYQPNSAHTPANLVATGIEATDAPSSGHTQVDLWGGSIGNPDPGIRGEVFGGGWGQHTKVLGNVGINFGEANDTQSAYPTLIGDLYGGSALGNVNTATTSETPYTTTINIDNGTVNGNIYGGGLGYKDNNPLNDVEAKVFGVVHVNVGRDAGGGSYTGKASFVDSSIFGSNNVNGSPQDQVYVDVYQTAHTEKDMATYILTDRTYAIFQVFGGGNEANYHPESNGPGEHDDWSKKTHVNIHGCENTIQWVFGGSNAADTDGVETVVDGGRFDFFFGGGNGVVAESNVFYGGASSRLKGGRYGWYFSGSNRLGSCYRLEFDDHATGECGDIIVDYFFNGGNQADQFGELLLELKCNDQAKTYLAVYGGCRLGKVYGNITINVEGGTFGSIFGGCQGAEDYAAPVKKYPTLAEITAHPDDYPTGLSEFLVSNPTLYGTGGNITINVYGGAIGDLFGGCDINGNVEGKITINVESEGNDCGLFVGNVYGASNRTDYTPVDEINNTYSPNDPDAVSTPEVNIKKGTIGGFYDIDGHEPIEHYEGNVYGGGNRGAVTSNPKVVVGEKDGSGQFKPVTIKGNVYGGGREGDVNGSSQVIIGPVSE